MGWQLQSRGTASSAFDAEHPFAHRLGRGVYADAYPDLGSNAHSDSITDIDSCLPTDQSDRGARRNAGTHADRDNDPAAK